MLGFFVFNLDDSRFYKMIDNIPIVPVGSDVFVCGDMFTIGRYSLNLGSPNHLECSIFAGDGRHSTDFVDEDDGLDWESFLLSDGWRKEIQNENPFLR